MSNSTQVIRWRQGAYDEPQAVLTEGLPDDRQSRRVGVLIRAANALGVSLTQKDLLPALLDLIFEELAADRAAVLLSVGAGKKQRVVISRSAAGVERQPDLQLSHSIVSEAIQSKESLLILDARDDAHLRDQDSVVRLGIRSAICAPMLRKGRVLGVLYVDTSEGSQRFGRDDLDLLGAMASMAAVGIERTQLYRIAAERERLRSELAIAASIQSGLALEEHPILPGLDFHACTRPAKHVGGDLCEAVQIDDRRALLAVADVTGKGVPAAILSASVQSSIRSLARAGLELSELAAWINNLVYEQTDPSRFVTCFLACYDSRERTLRSCCAGHDRPLFLPGGREPAEELSVGGLVLGVRRDERYECETRALKPGDLVVCYTDGVTEARSKDGSHEELGIDGLIRVLAELSPEADAEAVTKHLWRTIETFTGGSEPADDRALAVLRAVP